MTWIEDRETWMTKNRMRVCADPPTARPDWPGWILAQIDWREQHHGVWLDDEYGDLEKGFPALSLEVVVRSCRLYQEAENARIWARNNRAPLTPADAHEHWSRGLKFSRSILPCFEAEFQDISDLDWQLNSGLAFELRSQGT